MNHLPVPRAGPTLRRAHGPAAALARDGTVEQLRAALARELARRRQMVLELFDARSALAQARAELAGTRAGERQARHQCLHDDLTGLPNRGHFRERLAAALIDARAGPTAHAVLYLDLDGFKPINDEHGHHIGDELLRIVARRLTRAVRAEDMVARLGGDEFACLMVQLSDRALLSHLAGQLVKAIAQPVKLGRVELKVRASIGIAVSPSGRDTAEALLESADAAMYHAKRARCGYAFFDTPAAP